MVSVRLEDDEFENKLVQAGVNVVMPQYLEPSLQPATKALQAVGTPQDEVTQAIEMFRKNYIKISSKNYATQQNL